MATKSVNPLEMPVKGYEAAAPLWCETRAAVIGKPAILELQGVLQAPLYKIRPAYRNGQDELVPSNERDVLTRKQAYWKRARYFNATGRTHDTLDGMIWSKLPEMELPSQLEYLNNKGIGLRAISQQITSNVISIGRHGALVDMPNTGGNASRAEQASGDKAPCIVTYKAEQIIYWREDSQLLEVRLLETYEERKDKFTIEEKPQVRRLVLIEGVYHNEIYREGEKQDEMSFTPVMNGSNMDFIPFQFFGADDNSSNIGAIPLFDLGSQNLGHYSLDADNRDNLHYHGQGMTVVYTDMDRDEFNEANPIGLDVGAKGSNQLNQGDKVEVIQIEATGAIAAEMLRDEQRMVMLGAQLVTDTGGIETATAKKIDSNATTSTLKRISMNCSEGIEQLLQWCADFLGAPGDIAYTLNTEFVTDSMDAQMVAQHFAAVQAGYLPQSSYYETARKTGFTKKTDEELITEIGEQALGVAGTDENTATLMAEIESLKEQLANRDT